MRDKSDNFSRNLDQDDLRDQSKKNRDGNNGHKYIVGLAIIAAVFMIVYAIVEIVL